MSGLGEGSGGVFLPALRSRIGDWDYYITQMSLAQVVESVSVAEEIHKSRRLNELIQRQLSARAPTIAKYLISQEQRFLGAFVIGVYGGEPHWYELEVDSKPYWSDGGTGLPESIERALGFLQLSGSEKLFAIDGQHRVVGIRKALTACPEMGQEHVAAIFVAHATSEEGLQRTRRLFTTLNRYAKPINKLDKIALDEDDATAIVVRQLVEEHPLFRDRVALAAGNSLPTGDAHSFTTIGALYDATDTIIRNKNRSQWSNFKRVRPTDEVIAELSGVATEYWSRLAAGFPELRALADSERSEVARPRLRDQTHGGHILFRPIGLIIYARTAKSLVETGLSLDDVISRL